MSEKIYMHINYITLEILCDWLINIMWMSLKKIKNYVNLTENKPKKKPGCGGDDKDEKGITD